MTTRPTLLSVLILSVASSALPWTRGVLAQDNQQGSEDWRPLFNGRDLEGWVVKITGHDLNDNFGNTG